MISIDAKEKLSRLGLRLRECRLDKNEPYPVLSYITD